MSLLAMLIDRPEHNWESKVVGTQSSTMVALVGHDLRHRV